MNALGNIQGDPSLSLYRASATAHLTDLLHVIVTGQSNAVAQDAGPALTVVSVGRTRMFNGGVYPGGSPGNLASFVPLVESVSADTFGETVCAAIAASLAAANPSALVLVSLTGADDKRYSELKKGTGYYADSIAHVTAAKALADAAGLTYRVLGVCAVHGEKDQAFGNTAYDANLIEWQGDYEADIQAISGQAEAVPLFVSQQSGYAPDNGNALGFTASSALLALAAHESQPAKVVVVAPTYFFDYAGELHFCNWAHRWLGEYFARAISAAGVFHGLSPVSAVLVGSQVVISFHVPSPPLAWDFENVLFQPNYGFAYVDDSASASITAVAITGPAQVTITLSAVPTGAHPEIRYGCDTFIEAVPKLGNGKGNLVDSDGSASLYGLPLANHCVCFRKLL